MNNKFKFGDKVWHDIEPVGFGVVISTENGESYVAFKSGTMDWFSDAELTLATGWVKCSERMPELYESVLVLYTDGSISDDWTIERKGQRTWNCISTEDATHWMPLPDLPTEDA